MKVDESQLLKFLEEFTKGEFYLGLKEHRLAKRTAILESLSMPDQTIEQIAFLQGRASELASDLVMEKLNELREKFKTKGAENA